MLAAIIALGVIALAQAFLIYALLKQTAYERASLLQRIQDPINAVSLHSAERQIEMEGGAPPVVDPREMQSDTFTLPLDDDDAMNEYAQEFEGRLAAERESWVA